MIKLGTLDVAGQTYTLALGETYLIGVRSNDFVQDIEIDDASVDLKHCMVDCSDKLLKIVDIRSKCGTFVDGVQIDACQMVPLLKSVTLHFGKVEASLQLTNEVSECCPEERTSPPKNDDSEIVCNSPDRVSVASSRMRHAFQISSTSNIVTPSTSSDLLNSNKSLQSFAIPTADNVRRSTASNASVKSSDSFCIPETQCLVENENKHNNYSITSLNNNNQSKDKSTNINEDNDDFFIPETQEIVGIADKLAPDCLPRIAFENESVNETIVDSNKIPSSQFRICTQEFNGSENGNSNDSEDILANISCSLAIPPIRHSPVQIDTLLDINNDEEEIEKEMSALQWSKKTGEGAETSVTPDDIVPRDISVTPDIIHETVECQKGPSVQDNEPDVVADPEQPAVPVDGNKENNEQVAVLEQDLLPTQLFVKPQLMRSSISKSHSPISNKKNKGQQKDDSGFLAPTQVFSPSKVKRTSLPKPRTYERPSHKSPAIAEDDLPPTQVFEKISSAPPADSSKNTLLSSTLLDSALQLSESSFRARCNKLLDSDDDEMDEIIAPVLAKKMREDLEKIQQPPELTAKSPNIEKQLEENAIAPLSKEKQVEKELVTPKSKFLASESTAKKSARPQPAVSIDDFLFTPDFVAKEFSKGEKLQELAEVNWKKLVSSKQRRNLFADDESGGKLLSSECSTAQDSGIDLKLELEKRKKSSSSNSENLVEKNVSGKKSPALPAEKVSRRRKSTFPEEIKNKWPRQSKSRAEKDPNTNTELTKKEEKSENSKKKSKMETETKDCHKKDTETAEKPKLMGRERIKLRRIHHISKEADKKTDKTKRETSHSEGTAKATSQNSTESRHHTKHKESSVADTSGTKATSQIRNESRHHTKDKERLVNDNSSKIEPKEPEKKTKADVYNKKASKRGLRSEKKNSPKRSTETSEKNSTLAPVKTQEAVSTKIEEEKPAPRLTRLKSRMNSTTLNKDEAPIEIVKRKIVPVSDVSTSKVVNETPINEVAPIIDLINSDSEEATRKTRSQNEKSSQERSATDAVSAATVTKTEKRKNGTADASNKRIRSAPDKTAPADSSKSLLRPHTAKLKIAMTMCDPRYQDLLERHSGSLWIYSKDPKECDVLVVEKGNRTYKLMVAIARGVPIVRLTWFIEVLKTKSANVSFESHIFDEPQFQARHHFDIRKTLSLAKTTSLFKGMTFMMTPSIRPIPEEMKDIVTCSGGIVIEQVPKLKTYQRIYLISQSNDNQYWHKYRRSNAHIKIVTSEGVMASVMQQSEKPLLESVIQ